MRRARRARRDPLTAALIRALSGCTEAVLTTEQDKTVEWASATFIGARHELVLVVNGEDASTRADVLAAMLPSHEFAVRGHIVADVTAAVMRSDDRVVRVKIDVLTIED